MCSCLLLSSLLLITFTLYNPPFAFSDTAQYFYDSLGRLTQVVNGSAVTDYVYDEVGNILSVSNGSLADAPSVTSVDTTTLLVGVRTAVVFTGQNLLSVGTISSLNGLFQINSVAASPGSITAMLTATSAGTDTVQVTFRDNNQTVYQAGISTVASIVIKTPPVAAGLPNSTVTASISLNPPLPVPLTIGLRTDNVSIATVPASITIPAGGSAPLQITTNALGYSSISSLNNIIFGYVVSEKQIGANGVSAFPVSISIDPSITPVASSQDMSSPVSIAITPSVQPVDPSSEISLPVSIAVAPTAQPVAPASEMALPVSIAVAPTATPVAPASGMALPMSIQIAPTATPINSSLTEAPQISVTVSH